MMKGEDLAEILGISSAEAADLHARLGEYVEQVERWNKTINIVSKATLPEVWKRHVLDSAQLFPVGAAVGRWVDLGSGGGFPGIVVAILAQSLQPDMHVTLVESDLRKSVFLREVSRRLGLATTVLTNRIEDLAPQSADIVSARALARLAQLCHYAHRHLRPGGTAIFLKGGLAAEEVEEARRDWSFDLTVVPSVTQEGSSVLSLRELRLGK